MGTVLRLEFKRRKSNMNILKILIGIFALVAANKNSLMTSLQEKLDMLEDEIADLKKDKIMKSEKLVEIEQENAELKLKVEDVRNPPFYHMCSYRDVYSTSDHLIPFDKIIYLSSYRCDDADIDLNTGTFTAGWPGTYTVTWDFSAWNEKGLNIHLRKNGIKVEESYHHSYSHDDDSDQGGRTLLFHLDSGDTLSLFCEQCDSPYYGVEYLTFCVSLSTFDVI